MGLAEAPSHGTCRGSIGWCLCEAIRHKLSRVMNANLDAVRCSANGPYVKSVAWAFRIMARCLLRRGTWRGEDAQCAYCDTMKHKHDAFIVAVCDLVHP
eukprot:2222364-Pleurochrysis_carterae.AAC.1